MKRILNLPVDEICEKYMSGMSIVELAKEYKCDRGVISRRLRDNNVKIRSNSDVHKGLQSGKDNPRYINLPIDEISKKYLNGMNTVELAKEYGCSDPTITIKLRDNGIKIRSNSEAQIGLQSGKNNPNYRNLPIEGICEKYLSGINISELAKEYSCSAHIITDRLRDNNIEIRTTSESLKGRKLSQENCERISAGHQGIPYEEWESFAAEQKYCPLFDDKCRESNREKYGRMCFLTGLSETENITKNGKHRKLSVHHVDMDKTQGCNGKRWRLIPVCLKWHPKIHTKIWEARIIWLLENIWI